MKRCARKKNVLVLGLTIYTTKCEQTRVLSTPDSQRISTDGSLSVAAKQNKCHALYETIQNF